MMLHPGQEQARSTLVRFPSIRLLPILALLEREFEIDGIASNTFFCMLLEQQASMRGARFNSFTPTDYRGKRM